MVKKKDLRYKRDAQWTNNEEGRANNRYDKRKKQLFPQIFCSYRETNCKYSLVGSRLSESVRLAREKKALATPRKSIYCSWRGTQRREVFRLPMPSIHIRTMEYHEWNV